MSCVYLYTQYICFNLLSIVNSISTNRCRIFLLFRGTAGPLRNVLTLNIDQEHLDVVQGNHYVRIRLFCLTRPLEHTHLLIISDWVSIIERKNRLVILSLVYRQHFCHWGSFAISGEFVPSGKGQIHVGFILFIK